MAKTAKKNDEPKGTVLWIENQPDFCEGRVFPLHTKFLEHEGIQVVRIASILDDKALEDQYDLYIVDYRLNGTEDGEQFIRRVVDKYPNSKFILFSSFSGKDGLDQLARDLENELLVSIGLIAKEEIPDSISELKSNFVDRIVDLVRGITNPSSIMPVMHVTPEARKHLTLEEYHRLELSEKSLVLEEFYDNHEKNILREFGSGAIWVLYFPDSDEPAWRVDRGETVPSREEVLVFARKHNKPPLKFRPPETIETISDVLDKHSNSCGTYPYVSMEISDEKVDFHFDTGSYINFFNAEFLQEKIPCDFSQPDLMPTNVGKFTGIEINVDAIVQLGDDNSRKKKVEIVGWATTNWEKSGLKLICKSSCANGCKVSEFCQNRWSGLIGRRFLVDEKLELLISGISSNTKLLEPEG